MFHHVMNVLYFRLPILAVSVALVYLTKYMNFASKIQHIKWWKFSHIFSYNMHNTSAHS
jgi:hypothetical protein